MTADDYYIKMTSIEEAKLEETKRHNKAMEEIARSTLEEKKRHHLELERQSVNSIPTAPRLSAYPADSYVPNGQFSGYNPQMPY